MPEPRQPKTWSQWYHFAREELGFLHDECVEYANLRFVEEQNRASLRSRARGAPSPPAGRARPGLRPG